MQLKIFRRHPDATLPTKGSKDAAGYDLYALEDGIVTNSPKIVKTGISIAVPEGKTLRYIINCFSNS